MRVPAGGRLLPGCGASGIGRFPTPDCPPSGQAAGANYPLAVGAGGRLLPGCGASGVVRSPIPDCPPSGRAVGAHYPLDVGAGGCGRGDPSPTPQRALFRAGFARCGGGMRVPAGGRLLPGCGASGIGRSPTPDCPPSGQAAGANYPLAVGAGGRGRGDPSPTPQRALLRAGFARCGGGMRVPAGGRLLPGCGASGVGRSPTPDCPPFGRAARLLCVCVPCLAGSAGPASRARLGPPHFSFGLSCFALCLLGPLRAGVALFVVVVGFFCFFVFFLLLFPFSPSLRPRFVLLCVFSGPGCLGPWRLVPPPPPPFFVFSPPPPLCAPLSPALRVFRPGVPWALASCCPPPSPFFLFFFAPPPLPVVSLFFCFLVAFGLRASSPSPPFFFFLSCCFFSCFASAVCVLGCRAVCSLSCPFVGLCALSVLFLVAGVVGSWCRCLLLRVCWWLWLPGVVVWWCVSALVPVSGLAVAGRPPCGVPLPCAVSCGAVLPCGAVLWCPVFCRRCSSPAAPAPPSLAPCPVPRFVVCCARFPGSRHPVAVVAWHLSSCRGCGRRRASLACLVAPRWCAAPRPVRSLSVLRSAFPSPWCLPPPERLSPPALLGGCAGHVEAGREPESLCLPLAPAEARALGT